MPKSYNEATADFENAVRQMQKDLEFLANKDKPPSPIFFDKQNRIIKSLITYHQRVEAYIAHLENEALYYQKAKRKQLLKYEDRIISFEAICIIHGIIDFPMWLSLGKTTLLYQAEYLGKDQKMRLPNLLNEKLDKLPKNERKTVLDILQKEVNEELKKLFLSLSPKNKQKLLNETRTQRNKTSV